MDSDSRAIILVILLFIASAYCALAETAFASVSKNKIKILSDKGNRRAKKAMYVIDNFEDAITTILICTNVAHIMAASTVTVYVTRKWGLSFVTISTVVTTIAMFFVGEMIPKSIGKKASIEMSLFCSGLLSVLMKILKPFAGLLSRIGETLLKHIKSDEEVSVTEDEIYDIIEDMMEEGALDEKQSDLISSALSFGEVTVGAILTPRVDIVGIDINTDADAVLDFARQQTHSRIVVYDKTIDNVVGVLQIRKFLKGYIVSGEIPSVRELMDEVYYAHSSIQIDELLGNMTKNRLNMAVILDGYGGVLGIVTVEDILEEIVGEIWDESDVVSEPIVALTDKVFIVNADETVSDAFEYIGFDDPDSDENEDRFTNLIMSDWIYEHFDTIPKVGDCFDYYELKVTVSSEEHNRILKATITVTDKIIDNKEEEE